MPRRRVLVPIGVGKQASRLLLIRLFQPTAIGSMHKCAPRIPEDTARVSIEVCRRGGLSTISGRLSLAGWLRMSEMWRPPGV
jgi:hypothetical protein